MELRDMVAALEGLTDEELAELLKAIPDAGHRPPVERQVIADAALTMLWNLDADKAVKARVLADEWVTIEDFRGALVEEIERDGGVVIYAGSEGRHAWPELDRMGVEVIASGNPEAWNPLQDWGTVWIKVYQSDIERLRERVA